MARYCGCEHDAGPNSHNQQLEQGFGKEGEVRRDHFPSSVRKRAGGGGLNAVLFGSCSPCPWMIVLVPSADVGLWVIFSFPLCFIKQP